MLCNSFLAHGWQNFCGNRLLWPGSSQPFPAQGLTLPGGDLVYLLTAWHLTLGGWLPEGWTLKSKESWRGSTGKWDKEEGQPAGPESNSPWQHREAGTGRALNSLASTSSEKTDFHLWLLMEWEITPYLIL